MDFEPCKCDSDIWMRQADYGYEYIAVYVDDLAIASRTPENIIKDLKDIHNLKLKGVGPLSYHLGCDFIRGPDGVLSYGPKKYIKKMVDNFEKLFKESPRDYSSPLEKNDHPELDSSPLLDNDGIRMYQSLIGGAQWAITLGRFDIHTAIMTMSQFRIAPRVGHMNRMKRIYGYLKKFSNGAIRVNIDEPDYSNIQDIEYDWASTVYGNVKEELPTDLPVSKGKPVILSHYVDANLYHDFITGRSVTGIIHFANRTPIEWFSKKQATVETATYGSEFVAARLAVEQIIEIRLMFKYLGVPIKTKSYLFGDNNSVIINSTIPHSCLKKRHNALSYHRVREAIAAKIIGFHKVPSSMNFADIMSKHTGHAEAWPLIRPLLFWDWDNKKNLKSANVDQKIGECQPKLDIG
jgi:hypothetical protein